MTFFIFFFLCDSATLRENKLNFIGKSQEVFLSFLKKLTLLETSMG
jgi:hypothetical protein